MADRAETIDEPADHSRPASGSTSASVRRGGSRRSTAAAVVVAILAIVGVLAAGRDRSSPEPIPPVERDPDEVTGSVTGDSLDGSGVPPELLAAERHVAEPGPATLRTLVEAVGGLDAVVVGEAVGAFDLVRFDPLDHDRLLASKRSSYGRAENQDRNERWTVGRSGVEQTLWAPELAHDFVHFNADGSITIWVNENEGANFAPRRAVVRLDAEATVATSAPIYASRFTATADAVFALTGSGDYYSNDEEYLELIADGTTSKVLAPGAGLAWIDIPVPGLLVAYPRQDSMTTIAWDTETLLPVDASPLVGRRHQRSAVSGDGRTAVGVTFDGRLEQIDMVTGRVLADFGSLDPRGIDQPLTVNADGTLVTTVDRSGAVTLWWVGDDRPIARVEASSAQPRWVSERYGARSASAVSRNGERVALRSAARPQIPVTWTIIDTSPDRWVARACELAGRALTVDERETLGLQGPVAACI